MKKTLKIVLAFMLVLLCYATVVNAATPTERIMEYASQTIEINGETFKLSSSDLLRVEKYLKQYPVTDDTVADQIIAKGNAALNIMKAAGVADPTKLPKDSKKQVLALAQEAAALAKANLTYDASTKTAVVSKDNVEIDRIKVGPTNLVQTGSDNTVLVCVTAVAVIAIATITIVKVRNIKENA